MRVALLTGFSLAALVLASCSMGPSSGVPSDSDAVASAKSAIINGQLDTTHDAVVAILSFKEGTGGAEDEGGECSGTIVKVDAARHIGWVLTAAHCVEIPPVVVRQGPDYADSGAIQYQVIDYAADSRWGGNTGPYDFAVVRIAGVDASTPTIPIVGSPDGVTLGTPVVSVGYGRTTGGAVTANENSKRYSVAKTLNNDVTSTLVSFTMTNSGICQGDSGGPVLVTSGGTEYVAAVHAFVSGAACRGTGYSGRVTSGLSFINAELSKALPPDDCGLCTKVSRSGTGVCATLEKSCFADKECNGYYECLVSGASRSSCTAKFPKAEGPFNAVANCTCTRACATQCTGGVDCQAVPKCGYKLPAGECSSCTEGACCDEALECAADGDCYLCLKTKDADPGCATNAVRKKMATCVASKCKTQCEGTGLDTGADPEVPEGSGGATTDAGGAGGSKTVITETSCAFAPASEGPSGWLAFASAGLLALLGRRRRASATRA